MTEQSSDGLVGRLRAFETFLRGAGELDGLWFGDAKAIPNGLSVSFWWRCYLSDLSEAADRILTLESEQGTRDE